MLERELDGLQLIIRNLKDEKGVKFSLPESLTQSQGPSSTTKYQEFNSQKPVLQASSSKVNLGEAYQDLI